MWLLSGSSKLQLPCATSQSYEVTPGYSTVVSLEGIKQAHAYKHAKPLRTWSMTAMRSDEKAALIEALPFFLPGEEYGFIPTGAEKMNLLTPGASLLNSDVSREAMLGMQVATQSEYYPGGVAATSGDPRYGAMTPFPYAGKEVTISAVSDDESAVLWIEWLTATGKIISRTALSLNITSLIPTRKYMTAKAPINATHFTVIVRGRVSAPCMTLGDKLYPFRVGQAAKAVIIGEGKNELIGAWDTPISSHTLSITEVGEYV